MDFYCNMDGSHWWYRFRADNDDQLVDRLNELAAIIVQAAVSLQDEVADRAQFTLYFVHHLRPTQFPGKEAGVYATLCRLSLDAMALLPADQARSVMAAARALWHTVDTAIENLGIKK